MVTAPIFPIQVCNNTSYYEPLVWEVDGVAQDIENYIFYLEVRDNMRPNSPVVFSQSWTEIGTFAQGLTAIVFEPSQLAMLKKRGYYYILNMTDTNGFVRRILEGPIGVTQ